MASFDIITTFYKVDKKSPNAWLYNLLIGGASGMIAVTTTYPTDLVRRRMQLVDTQGQLRYTSMWDCYVKIC